MIKNDVDFLAKMDKNRQNRKNGRREHKKLQIDAWWCPLEDNEMHKDKSCAVSNDDLKEYA